MPDDFLVHYNFYKERAERFSRNVNNKIYENYQHRKVKFTTEKFYSKYDVQRIDPITLKRHLNLAEKVLTQDPRKTYKKPVVESQVYGWLLDEAIKYDEMDKNLLDHKRFYTIVTLQYDVSLKKLAMSKRH